MNFAGILPDSGQWSIEPRMVTPPSSAFHDNGRPVLLAYWLWFVAFLIVSIVVVGGITRLTESGLSITEWNPVTGALPPLTAADWLSEFHKYQQTPEYREINAGMSLAAFKHIFFWEWLHRLLGRVIGMAMALPLLWFIWRRAIPSGYQMRLLALLLMVGFQGAVGWWMVVSGLVNRTDVSHFRLAIHLLTALVILVGVVWTARDFQMLARNPAARPARAGGFVLLTAGFLIVQLLLGAWTAGLNAGQVASDWPMMNGIFLPAGINWSHGVWAAFTNDPFLIHFLHRWWAWATATMLALLAWRSWRAGGRREATVLAALIGTQIMLGIATVMSGVALPVAVLHQAVGALLVAATAIAAQRLGQRR